MNDTGAALVKLRALAGKGGKPLSQIEFCKMTGTPSGSLARIERGRNPLPDHISNRIEATFGCMASALIEGKLLALDRSPYTKEHLRLALSTELPQRGMEMVNEDLAKRIEMVLETLGPNRVFYGATRLRQAIDAVIEESGISANDLYSTGRKHSKMASKKTTVGKIAKGNDLSFLGFFAQKEDVVDDLKNAVKGFKQTDKVEIFIETFNRFPPSRMGGTFMIYSEIITALIRVILPNGKEVKLDSDGLTYKFHPLPTATYPPDQTTLEGIGVDHIINYPAESLSKP